MEQLSGRMEDSVAHWDAAEFLKNMISQGKKGEAEKHDDK